MNQAELTTEQILKRDIPWETYMTTKLINGTCLQLLRRYDKRSETQRVALLDEDGPAYARVFISILRDIFKEETVEYVLALIDEMLTANPKRAKLFHDQSLENDDIYEPFLRLLWKGNWFIQEKSCKILTLIVSARKDSGIVATGGASNSKKKITSIDDVLKGLVDWLCSQLKKPSHPSRGIPTAVNCLATLLKEPVVRSSFVQNDAVKLLSPLISPASTQQSIQLLYETCLCVWLLSYFEPAVEYLATTRTLPRLIDVVKSSTKEKILRVLITILDTSSDAKALAVACFDLSQFIQYHPAGRIIVNDLKAKERVMVMKLMTHENPEVTKSALLCIQRLFLGAKYASFLQA